MVTIGKANIFGGLSTVSSSRGIHLDMAVQSRINDLWMISMDHYTN